MEKGEESDITQMKQKTNGLRDAVGARQRRQRIDVERGNIKQKERSSSTFRTHLFWVLPVIIAGAIGLLFSVNMGRNFYPSEAPVIVEPSLEDEIAELERKCTQSDTTGCLELISFLQENTNEPPKPYMDKLCQFGSANDCHNIGFLITSGNIAGDPNLAASYFIVALQRGTPGPFYWKQIENEGMYALERPKHRAVVRELQRLLQLNGVYSGKIDGIVGEGTLQAARLLCQCALPLDS